MQRRDDARAAFEDGIRHERAGLPLDAARAYERALDSDPSLVDAALRLARVRESLGEHSRAVDALACAVSQSPLNVAFKVRWIRALLRAEAPLAALTALDELLQTRPHDLEILLLKGEALVKADRPSAALVVIERAHRLGPDRPDVLLARAELLTGLGRWREAQLAWAEVIKIIPNNPRVQAGQAELAFHAGEPSRSPPVDTPLATSVPSEAEVRREWARALILDGRVAEAAEAWRRALEQAPDQVEWLAGLAKEMEILEQWDSALAARKVHAELRPHQPEVQAALAQAVARARQARDGRESLLPSVALDTTSPDHALQLARSAVPAEREETTARVSARRAVEEGQRELEHLRFAEAADQLRQAADADPSWAVPWFLLGLCLEALEPGRPAIAAYDQALERDPQHLGAALHRAHALRRLRDFSEALAAYDRVLWAHPEEVGALAGRAETLRWMGRFSDAQRWFERALRVDPQSLTALCGKAASLTAMRHFEQARTVWQQVLARDPNLPFALAGIEQCELGLRKSLAAEPDLPTEEGPGRQAGAQANVPVVAEGEVQAARDEYDRGRSFQRDKDYAAATRCYERALQIDPNYVDAAFRLGHAHEEDRQFRKAIDAYGYCLQIRPDHVQAATNIGECHRKNERYKDAIKAYDRALKIKADHLYALAGRGESMRMLGEYEASLAWFDKAIAAGNRHTFALQGKAAALNALRRFKEAAPLWEKAVEVDPRSQFAQDGKSYCESQLKAAGKAEEKEKETKPENESLTPILDEQGRDLTALALEGKLTRVVGRDREIRSVMKTLVRRQKANPLLLGDPGVGKTAVVEGVAQVLASEDCPPRLLGLRVIELSMGGLVAGTKYRGTFEERLKSIIKECKNNPGIILFIDEIHTLVGAGRTEGGSLDAANILKPALARGELSVIGATTMAEYRKHFESDAALERRFQTTNVEEPNTSESIELLARVQEAYSDHHSVRIAPDALEACVRLAVRFIPDRRLPDKALDLLDEACAECSLSGREEVTAAMVAEVLGERTGIPAGRLTLEEKGRMAQLEDSLSERVIGQHEAVRQLANKVRMARTGLRATNKPRGVFLFTGTSGVGKTELARALADQLFPEGNALIRIDMSEFNEKHTASRLIGAPPGYLGHGEEGQLTGPLRRRPYSVVLLDEFEKADPQVQTIFLSLFDEGVITDADGRRVDAREAFFVITTNAGTEFVGRGRLGFGSDNEAAQRNAALERVKKHFRPELLNRIDDIVWFRTLSHADLCAIARIQLDGLRDRAAEVNVTLSWDEAVVEKIASHEPDALFGARPLLRALDTLVAEPLSLRLLAGSPKWLRARVQADEVVFEEIPDLVNA